MVYDVPLMLLNSGEHKDLETCPYDIFNAELVLGEVIKYRIIQPDSHQLHIDPEALSYDYYYVPNYSACHYHQCISKPGADLKECRKRVTKYMSAILEWVEQTYPFWDRNHGVDHIFTFSWGQASLLFQDTFLRNRLASSIHLTHAGSKQTDSVFNPDKDISIPALRFFNRLEEFSDRFETNLEQPAVTKPIFAYFRGTFKNETIDGRIYGRGIRQAIKQLGDTDPRHFFIKDGHSNYYWNEIVKSRFTLCPPGWNPWSPRLFDAVAAGSIPVIISDDWEPPFSFILNYRDLSIRVAEDDVGRLKDILLAIPIEEEARLRKNLQSAYQHYVYDYDPHSESDAFETIYQILTKRKQEKEERIRIILSQFETEASDSDNLHHLSDEDSVNDDILFTRVEL